MYTYRNRITSSINLVSTAISGILLNFNMSEPEGERVKKPPDDFVLTRCWLFNRPNHHHYFHVSGERRTEIGTFPAKMNARKWYWSHPASLEINRKKETRHSSELFSRENVDQNDGETAQRGQRDRQAAARQRQRQSANVQQSQAGGVGKLEGRQIRWVLIFRSLSVLQAWPFHTQKGDRTGDE